jgi:hypothetical protein
MILMTRPVFVSFVTFVGLVSFVPRASGASAWQAGELLDRTLAIVGGQVITLSDARTAVALGLVGPVAGTAEPGAITPRLVDRMLMLREVQRYAPPEPPMAEIDAQVAIVKARFADPASFARVLEAGGVTETWVRAWIRDDRRIASYLDQRFADERRDDLVADWLADLRRRTAVVELWRN